MAAVLAVLHVPLGDHMARVYTSERHWRVERFVCRMAGVDPDREQRWSFYLLSVLPFSVVSVLGQRTRPIGAGTLGTHTAPFVGLMIGAVLIVVGLEHLPALALGPIAEGVS